MLHILLVRPGSTDFDEQGRIKGTLDIPLSEHGTQQVAQAADALAELEIESIYTSPSQSAQQTAAALAAGRSRKIKVVENLKNLDHGLWHGKLIDEVKQQQPKVYRQWQEHPETVCPPQGETLGAARQRASAVLTKLLKKHRQGTIALVVAEPLATVVRSLLQPSELGDLWKVECDSGTWELIEFETERPVHS